MRQITHDIAMAFKFKRALKVDNTETDGKEIRLHGHRIVWRKYLPDGTTAVCYAQAGWPTNTTHERLNGVATIMRHDIDFYRAEGIGCCVAEEIRYINTAKCVFMFDELSGEFIAAYDSNSPDKHAFNTGERADA